MGIEQVETVKVVQSTADIKVGDVLECPHGLIELVTGIIDNQRYEATVLFAEGDSPENHMNCARRILKSLGGDRKVTHGQS